jgi:hypothetical protein
MRSFGLWYKKGSDITDDSMPRFSLHINFWSESVKKHHTVPDLDIGIKIINFRNVDGFVFHCPFVFVEDDVSDLIPKLVNKTNANMIFNSDGETETKNEYTIYSYDRNNEKEKLLLFPLSQADEDVYLLDKYDGKTEMTFDISDFKKLLIQKSKFDDIKTIYLRFRITTKQLSNIIFFDSEPTNKSFGSAFSGTRIFDFKINEKRNLGSKTIKNVELNNYVIPILEDTHLLLMEPSSYDVTSYTNQPMTCRELEGRLWDDYINSEVDTSKERILAYHWKFEQGCTCLIKVKYSKTNKRILSAYVLIVIALGMTGSFAITLFQTLINDSLSMYSIVSGLVILIVFGLGILLGNV